MVRTFKLHRQMSTKYQIEQSLMVARTVLLAIMLFCGIHCFADDFTVFSVTGKVNAGAESIKKGMTLKSTTEVVIGENSKLVLIDDKNNKIVTVQGSTKGKVSEVVASSNSSLKSVTASYITYMKQKMTDTSRDKDHMQSAGTSYRETDSIAAENLKKIQSRDQVQENDSIKK